MCVIPGARLAAQPVLTPSRIAALRPLVSSAIPGDATFWLVKGPDGNGASPPLPAFPPALSGLGLPLFSLGDGNILIDDSSVDYSELDAASQSALGLRNMATLNSLALPDPSDGGSGDGDDGGTNTQPYALVYAFDTNGLWLEITNVANGLAYLNLHNATNPVYAIWSTTDLPQGWQVEAEVWPSNPTVMPFTVPTLGRQNLLMRAEDWTGVDSDGDGIPDWWIWLYFGNLSETATNLDSQGNTLLHDYTNGLDPNVLTFTLSAASSYVNQTAVPIQIGLFAGDPSYYAVLVNDASPANANWLPYAGTNITVNLGPADGAYAVSVGLRGLAPSAQQTGQTLRLTLDTVPPTLVLTAPGASTTAQPIIQVQGYATKYLSRVTYGVSNALWQVSGQAGFVVSQYFDPALLAFTTNWIRCYDVDLVPGVNVIALQATDRAGNTATTNFSITLDYSMASSPVVQVVWPRDGSQVCASVFTCRGTLDDPTANITAQIADTSGDTAGVGGMVGRNGTFWLESLPLNAGSNTLTIAVTNAAGLATVTNLTLVQGVQTLAMAMPPSDQLWQPTLSVVGTVSDPGCAVSVNGAQGVNNGDGTWYALNLPASAGGVACFDISALSGGAAFVNNITTNKPAQIVVTTYLNDWTTSYTPDGGSGSGPQPKAAKPASTEHYHLFWQEDIGTTALDTVTEQGLVCTTNYTWPADEDIVNVRAPSQNGVATYTCATNVDLVAPPTITLESCGVATTGAGDGGTSTYSRTALTVLALWTGGKGESHHQNLFQITGSAFAITNLSPVLGCAVPPTNVEMGALGALGTDGNLWRALQDNVTNIITPTVSGAPSPSNYTFTAGSQKYRLYIAANSTPLEDYRVAPFAHYCVGQYIGFAPFWVPTVPGCTTQTVQWQFAGNYVNDFWQLQKWVSYYPLAGGYYTPYGSVNYTTNTNSLTNVTTHAWWVSGGASYPGTEYSAALQDTLSFANGQIAKVFRSGKCDVYRPSLANWNQSVQAIVTNYIADGDEQISVGTQRGGNAMTFSARVLSAYPGVAFFTQVYDDSSYPRNYGSNTLDWVEVYPHEGQVNVLTNSGALNTPLFDDTPNESALDGSSVSLVIQFRDYLRFMPSVGQGPNISITLGKVNWGVNASATYTNGGWILDAGNPVIPSWGDSEEFPFWIGVGPGH